ncbi:MAG: uracil-DNA glycosylase [Pseudomonadota bacterium]|uniref:uracil-DNA glycosylase n=1 Tax=Pseudoalteromonas spongiae TaxID=298657 RepID=UPI00026CA9A8|nr:uracil-DNA glycosylase [Pseudoalteromonas spongiae]ATC97966.1 uracil-DNA glycosylase [Pseudoalteromonas spongiae UST010723-006]MEC8326146.1 uracil-DNA glycosylase [Pseudomonadota bacterium]
MTTWTDVLAVEKQQDYFKDTLDYVAKRRAEGVNVFPPADEVFSAFSITAFDDVKVVILGQDPYHGPNQAHGLAFSVKPGIKAPPSLANMYKELATDIDGFTIPNHGYLQAWAEQGVLLLNTVLTVEQGQAHSHKKLGWETFTDRVIAALNEHGDGIVFLLWGSHAQKKGRHIDTTKHVVFNGPHPSPLSAYRGFFGCKHFSKANDALITMGKTPINWLLPKEV